MILSHNRWADCSSTSSGPQHPYSDYYRSTVCQIVKGCDSKSLCYVNLSDPQLRRVVPQIHAPCGGYRALGPRCCRRRCSCIRASAAASVRGNACTCLHTKPHARSLCDDVFSHESLTHCCNTSPSLCSLLLSLSLTFAPTTLRHSFRLRDNKNTVPTGCRTQSRKLSSPTPGPLGML